MQFEAIFALCVALVYGEFDVVTEKIINGKHRKVMKIWIKISNKIWN